MRLVDFNAHLMFQFGVTLLYLILSEGERMQSSDPNCQLMDDNRWWAYSHMITHHDNIPLLLYGLCNVLVSCFRTELVFSVTRELLQVPSSSLSPPLFTPPNLLSLFSRYVDRQRLEQLQEKLQWVLHHTDAKRNLFSPEITTVRSLWVSSIQIM